MIYRGFVKRLLDILLSLIAMPFVLLLIIIMSPLIWLCDRGPVFYCAPRMGRRGKVFRMIKFRSMYCNSPDLRNTDGSTYNGENDPRVTKIGRIMRKTSIDELPQLINVLVGDMSFIGPRPTLATLSYDDYDETRRKRLEVRPGITGYAQAYFRNSITAEEKFAYDCWYVDNLSFVTDIKILVKTAVSVLGRKNIYVSAQNAGDAASRADLSAVASVKEAEKNKDGAL